MIAFMITLWQTDVNGSFVTHLFIGFLCSISYMDKTDVKDSSVITDRLRFGRTPQGHIPDVDFLALQWLTRFRYHFWRSVRQSLRITPNPFCS